MGKRSRIPLIPGLKRIPLFEAGGGSIALPQVVTNGAHTLDIVADPGGGTFTLTGTENDVPWGPFTVTAVQLAADEHNLRAIAISGTGTVGETLIAAPGLWIGDPALPLTISHQWFRGATPISGATGLTYVLVSADAGQSITCRETVGDTTVTSNAISVAAGFTGPASLGAKLFFWGDMTDTSTLFQNTAGTTPATAVGNPVQRVNDKSGNGRHIWKTDEADPVVIAGGVNWNRGKLYAQGWTGVTSGMELFALIEPDSATNWALGGRHGDYGSNYVGIAEDGSGTTYVQSGSFGTPTYSVNGTDIASPTRDILYDAVKDTAGLKVYSARGVDLTGAGSDFALCALDAYNWYNLTGTIRHYVITTGLTTQERSDLVTWLMGQA